MDGKLIRMAALGCHFKLGDLYDYRTDRNLTEGQMVGATASSRCGNKFKLTLTCSDSMNDKWEEMNVDGHLQASIVAGLIDKYRGASNYVNEQPSANQATLTLICRAQTMEENMNLKDLDIREECQKPGATHIVVGIVYGAETYCVLSQNIDQDDDVEEDENLSKLATKFTNALEDNQNLDEFEEQFDKEERKQAANLKCRLYSDLQSQTVRECNIFNAYQHCLKLIEDIEDKAVPISVFLCPLNTSDSYHDVDANLVSRCCRILDELNRISFEAELVLKKCNGTKKANRVTLRKFESALVKYKTLLKTSLKNGVVKARENSDDNEVEKTVNIAENHQLFKPSRLEKWLSYKKAELEMAGKMASVKGIVFLPSKELLEKELAESFDKKYALVLSVPLLDQRTNEMLGAMKDFVENYYKLVAVDDDMDEEDDEEELPWFVAKDKRSSVLAKIRELAVHVEKNGHLEKQVQFFITPDKSGGRYSVYEADKLLKGNLSLLPGSPTGLRASAVKKSPSVKLEWDHEELGFPCQFLVQYRSKGSSDSWMEKKMSKPGETLSLKGGSAIEIRVAVDSCIGRTEFSDIVETEIGVGDDIDVDSLNGKMSQVQLQKRYVAETGQQTKIAPKTILQPPIGLEVDLVTQSTAELSWSKPSIKSSYRVQYWNNDQDPSSAHEIDIGVVTYCRLEHLDPETTYSVQIMAVSSDGQESAPSQIINLTTLDDQVRFAETIVKRCKTIGNRYGMDLHAVPLTKLKGPSTAERYVFGQKNGRIQHKTVLVMGATGSGKTSLINGMINYIFNVQWEDTFRFQLIQERQVGRSQVDSQTSKITAYDIHHAEGFRIPYSLTIVDTPGYGDTKGLERDQEITEMVRQFFEDKGGIQELDVIGFVAQASLPRLTPTQIYIFDSVLSIFGNDVKENINFLLTFADSQKPPVLSAITEAGLPYPTDDDGNPLHNRFNNSGFFCSNKQTAGRTADKFNQFFWKMGMENFSNFFNVLATMKTKSLSLTKQVLEERKTLEATVDGLQPLIKIGLAKMEEMRKTKQMISNCQNQIDANENVEFEVEVTMPKKVENRHGGYLTNCNKCYVTCHNPCAYPNDDQKVNCSSMNFSMPAAIRCCTVCPEKCIWNMHANQPYSWEYVNEKQVTSSDAIKKKYETELKKKLTAVELVKVLEKDVEANKKIVLNRVDTVSRCIKRLDEIALRPNPFSTPQYIDLIIDAEQQEKRAGFKERIESLKELRHKAVITSKVKNKKSLFTVDRDEDEADEDESTSEDESQSTCDSTADEDDDDDDDFASLTSASTDLQKFQTSFCN